MAVFKCICFGAYPWKVAVFLFLLTYVSPVVCQTSTPNVRLYDHFWFGRCCKPVVVRHSVHIPATAVLNRLWPPAYMFRQPICRLWPLALLLRPSLLHTFCGFLYRFFCCMCRNSTCTACALVYSVVTCLAACYKDCVAVCRNLCSAEHAAGRYADDLWTPAHLCQATAWISLLLPGRGGGGSECTAVLSNNHVPHF